MYIQDLIQWKDFNDDTLSFYRAIGVDMICLDIRSMHKLEGARDLRTGQDSAAFFGNANPTMIAIKNNEFFIKSI